jgi:hypothetical protein
MKTIFGTSSILAAITSICAVIVLFHPVSVSAHCDTMNGPVVKAAQRALETGDVNLVFLWVQKQDEPAIKKNFEHALSVRKLSPEAKALADTYFFETLVRIHRAGEGAPYTGVKPSGTDLGPAIPAADRAIEDGKAQPLVKLLTDAMHAGMHKRFEEVSAKKGFTKDNIEAGREYVKAYVEFTHYVEGLFEAAKGPAECHSHSSEGLELHKEKHH